MCVCIYMFIICTYVLFPFSGQACINDDEYRKETDLPDLESDTGCPRPVPPENGFIRVSILTFPSGLGFKKRERELKKYAFSKVRVIVFLV